MWDLLGGTAVDAEGNSTAAPSWEPQPTRRGTFGIISTCLVTLALCTWKIVHLNLPGICPQADLPYSAWWKRGGVTRSLRHRLVHVFGGHQIARQVGWLLIALFTPELASFPAQHAYLALGRRLVVAFAAFEQYWDARSLQRYMERVYLDESPRPSSRSGRSRRDGRMDIDVESDDADRPVWTITHSWYAVMGGYCYHLPEGFRIYLPEGQDRRELALRDEALRFVARNEPSVIPRLTVNAIMDKSTAGAFVKTVTLLQALWFILQCIARMILGLSISLLELTTLAHCLVGLVIGWLWLKKPLNISQADPLDVPGSAEEEPAHWLMAILYTLSSFDGEDADEDRYEKEKRRLASASTRPTHKHEASDYSGRTLRGEDSGDEQQVYLQPVGQHSPMSLGGLGLDVSPSPARPSPSSRPVTGEEDTTSSGEGPAATPTTSSRPGTRSTTSGRRRGPQTTPGSPPPPSTSKSPANSSLLAPSHADADAARRLELRMQMAQRGWEHYVLRPSAAAAGPGRDRPRRPTAATQRRLKRAFRNALVDRVPNFPRHRHHHHRRRRDDDDDGGRRAWPRTRLGIALTGLLYGGLHLLAWDASFESTAERALWRAAAVSLAASGLLVPVTRAEGVIGHVVRPWMGETDEEEEGEEEGERRGGRRGGAEGKEEVVGWWGRVCGRCSSWAMAVLRVAKVLLVAGVAVAYFGLRIFIFFECLVNLAHLPPSAYDVVRWSQYVPHIG